jgi:peptidoglycan hydrolase-like protein with peptidoglycan-binding domain
MRWLGILTLFAILLPALPAAPPAKSKSTHKRPVTRRKVSRVRKPASQVHPDPERYKEIQQALADKGYFKGDVNGQWGDDSVSAMKQFQADQKLPDDGKISAPALIGLGLGPKHEAAPAGQEAPPPAQ